MNQGPEDRVGLLRPGLNSQYSSQIGNTTYVGASDNDFELRQQQPGQQHFGGGGDRLIRPQKLKGTGKMVFKMLSFYLIAIGFMGLHLFFFIYLNEKPVNASINQELQAAIANILAIFVETFLLGGVGIAYDQIIWRVFRKKTLKADLIDRLVTFAASPWDLIRPTVLVRVPGIWFIGLLCALVPIAAVFPPGALTVEFDDVVARTLDKVPTMNVSDYGDGSIQSFIQHSLYEMNADLDSMNTLRPELLSMASQVLASGEPVKFESPCGSSCLYDISLDGPRFDCKEVSPDDALLTKQCSPIYKAKDLSDRTDDYTYVDNSFKISWYTKPSTQNCSVDNLKTLDCSVSLATYNLRVKNSIDATRSINVTVENERPFWDKDTPVQSRFYYYFIDRQKGTALDTPVQPDELLTNFTSAQAYSISRAAIKALEGQINYYVDGADKEDAPVFIRWFDGNATNVLGSPYIGINDRFNPSFNISAENLQRYLQDVVISTLSLNMSTNNEKIEAKVGENVYVFNSKLQFYAPYAACLFVVACIYIQGLWSLRANGSSAGSSFLQFATTTSTSNALRGMAAECSSGGDENVSEGLSNLRLRFGVLLGSPDAAPVYGFGTESEVRKSR